MSELTCFRH